MPQEEGKTIPSGSPPSQEIDEGQKDDPKEKELKEAEGKVGELAKELENLKKIHGEHTNEVGEARQQNEALTGQIETLQQTIATMENAKASTADQGLAAVYQKIDDGEITLAEGLKIIQEATKESTKQEVFDMTSRAFKEELNVRDRNTLQAQFLKDHPDFKELQNSGALDGIKAKNPMHDDFSAYFELVGSQAYEKGKTDQAEIEKGVEITEKVLTKPGASIRQVNKPTKPLTQAEMKESGLEALKKSREAGAPI